MMLRLGRFGSKTPSSKRTSFFRFFGALTPPKLNDTLHSRVRAREVNVKVTPVLDKWLKQGNEINPKDLRFVINDLCESNRFTHALQVSEWISERETFIPIPEDFASRLYLVEINSGLTKAETFFKTIPDNMKDDSVYTTLLSLYTKSKKSRHEAEATYHKMREQRMLSKPYPYYYMISLYGLLGEKNMVDEILRQMTENNVEHDNILTANNVLRAYANVPDVEAMEKYLMGVQEESPKFALVWQTGISMSKAYLKAGLKKKAIAMLRRTELVGDMNSNDSAKKVLLEMYNDAGAMEDELRLSRFIYRNGKKGKSSKIYKSKGSGGGNSHYPGYYYGGGCGGVYVSGVVYGASGDVKNCADGDNNDGGSGRDVGDNSGGSGTGGGDDGDGGGGGCGGGGGGCGGGD